MTNFASHVKGAGMDPKTVPLTFFRKTSGSINGPFDKIIKPPHVKLLDYEVEIGLIVSRDIPVGTTISESNWPDFIAGLVVTNDVSARDQQKSDGQWTRAKGHDTFCPVGPWIATDVDPADLELRTEVNGEVKQDSRTSLMIHDVGAIVEWISAVMTLLPGDLILTGTPAGVGPIVDGDTVRSRVPG